MFCTKHKLKSRHNTHNGAG